MNLFKKKKYVMVGDNDTVKDLEKRIEKLEGLLHFLSQNGKDDVVVRGHHAYPSTSGVVSSYDATYVYQREVKSVDIGYFKTGATAAVTANTEKMAVVQIDSRNFMIIKDKGIVVEVTEFCEDKEENK